MLRSRSAGGSAVTAGEGSSAASDSLVSGDKQVATRRVRLLARPHHLSDADKAAALDHIADVLTDDGVLHVADWGPPRGPATALGARALQLLDGRAGPQSLLDGQLPGLLAAAGLTASRRHAALRTAWGTLEVWRAQR